MANPLTKIPKFRRCVLQNFPFIEQDFDALTDYQLLCKVVEYLNKVISSQNAVIEVAESLTAAFNELQSFVENYFDNLDVQEEINNKLDDMAEAGTLQEIITAYIQSNVAWTFDTVADMKEATNLVDGSYARTLGFHAVGDGGSAIYRISNSGTADEMEVIVVGTLYAHLVKPVVVNPEIFGAYGDGTHNDSAAIQKAIDTDYPVIMTKNYLINSSIYIGNQDPSISGGYKKDISIDASTSNITYSGGNSAFVIAGLQGGNLRFGTIRANSGSCIEMWSTNGNVRVAYVNLSFNTLYPHEKGIYIHPVTNSSGTGFINEITINGGTIYSGDYGIYVYSDNESSSAGIGGHHYNNIGFEGCSVCFYGGVNVGSITGFTFTDVRYVEFDETTTLLELHGKVTNTRLHSWGRLYPSRLNISDATLNNVVIEAPIAPNRSSGTIASGLIIDNNNIDYQSNNYTSKSLTKETGAGGTIIYYHYGNQTFLSFIDVNATAATATLVSAANKACTPIRRMYATLTDFTGDKTALVSIETDGSIKLRQTSANIGTNYTGSLAFATYDIKQI